MLPLELLQAARQGELVVLVGAGASFDKPASVPLYHMLARNLYPTEWGALEDGSLEKRFPGNFLDRMAKADNKLHKKLHKKLAAAVSKAQQPSILPPENHGADGTGLDRGA